MRNFLLIFVCFCCSNLYAQDISSAEGFRQIDEYLTEAHGYDTALVICHQLEKQELSDSLRIELYVRKCAIHYYVTGRAKQLEVLEAGCAEFPNDFQLNIRTLIMYKNSGKMLRSRCYYYIQHTLIISKNWSDSMTTYVAYSDFLIDQGKFDSCIQLASFVLKKDSSSSLPHMNLATSYQAKKNHKKAIYHGEIARRMNPGVPDIHNNLGLYYIAVGDLEKAKEMLLRAIELDKDYAFAYSNLGFCYHKMKQYAMANKYYILSIKLNPNNSWVFKNMGLTKLQQGDLSRACVCFKQSKKLGYDSYYGQEVNELIEKYCDK